MKTRAKSRFHLQSDADTNCKFLDFGRNRMNLKRLAASQKFGQISPLEKSPLITDTPSVQPKFWFPPSAEHISYKLSEIQLTACSRQNTQFDWKKFAKNVIFNYTTHSTWFSLIFSAQNMQCCMLCLGVQWQRHWVLPSVVRCKSSGADFGVASFWARL